jgi:nicotinate-nucleotide--dimethylbenzimidazole phosphoribosyltransferase
MGVSSSLAPHPLLINKKIGAGTQNMLHGPAMTRSQAVESVEAGIDVVEKELNKGLDIIGIGEMGIGNTTAASAIGTVIPGASAALLPGRCTGLEHAQLQRKIDIINRALGVNKPDGNDAIDILSKVGGFEMGGMAGSILASAANHIPVVIDGCISGAAALLAVKLSPLAGEYLIASHQSAEPGHRIILNYLGLKPLLTLDMRLGEGTGAALGISLAEASVKILKGMRTFGEAGVSNRE